MCRVQAPQRDHEGVSSECSADHETSGRHATGVSRSYNGLRMPTPSTREQILEALRDLPDDATLDDAIERLIFLAKVDAGLAELDAGKAIPHEEVKSRLGL